MQVSKLQLFMLMQNQCLVIRSGMETTRMAKPFRTAFKKAIGLPAKASHLEVLKGIGYVYNQYGFLQEFWDYINKQSNLVEGKPLVTPEMLKETYGI